MKVLHLLRKNTQLNASFIYNQINYHSDFEPFVAYRLVNMRKFDGGFASNTNNQINNLNLANTENIIDRIIWVFFRRLSLRQTRIVSNYIVQNNITILHFHYGSDAGIYSLLLKKTKLPSVVSFYGYDCFSFPKVLFGYGRIFLVNRVFTKITKVLAMSPEMEKDLIRIGCPPEKIIVHYHGVPSTLSLIDRKYVDSKSINILMLSYLDPVKGHLFVLKALNSIISSGHNNIKLKIYGAGYYEQKIRKYIDYFSLTDYVELLGPLEYLSTEYKSAFKYADIFIHPSVLTKKDKEGIPGALIEAMFSGLPVISTYHGGIPYVVKENTTGILVSEWDVKNLVNKILLLSESSYLRETLGRAGRKYATECLDIIKKEERLEEIYKSLIIN